MARGRAVHQAEKNKGCVKLMTLASHQALRRRGHARRTRAMAAAPARRAQEEEQEARAHACDAADAQARRRTARRRFALLGDQGPGRGAPALLELRETTANGEPSCGIVYEPKLIADRAARASPFQGWRYLNADDAPADVRELKGGKGLPQALKVELAELGLL